MRYHRTEAQNLSSFQLISFVLCHLCLTVTPMAGHLSLNTEQLVTCPYDLRGRLGEMVTISVNKTLPDATSLYDIMTSRLILVMTGIA